MVPFLPPQIMSWSFLTNKTAYLCEDTLIGLAKLMQMATIAWWEENYSEQISERLVHLRGLG